MPPLGLFINKPWNLNPSLESTLSLIYLGIFPTGIAWLLRFMILKKNGLVFQSQHEAKEIIEDFLGMIKENPELKSEYITEDEKTKLMCLSGVKQYPMRVKCATLSWHTLISAIIFIKLILSPLAKKCASIVALMGVVDIKIAARLL